MKAVRVFAIAVVIASGALTAGNAKAEMSANDLLKRVDSASAAERSLILFNIGGNENGISWANTAVRNQFGKSLYCQPPKAVNSDEETLAMLRVQIRKTPIIGTVPYGLAILLSLQATYPCKNGE